MDHAQRNRIVNFNRAHRQGALIREYRTRLTADAVTGKLDVRHLAPTEQVAGDAIGGDEDLVDGLNDGETPGRDEAELVEEASGD